MIKRPEAAAAVPPAATLTTGTLGAAGTQMELPRPMRGGHGGRACRRDNTKKAYGGSSSVGTGDPTTSGSRETAIGIAQGGRGGGRSRWGVLEYIMHHSSSHSARRHQSISKHSTRGWPISSLEVGWSYIFSYASASTAPMLVGEYTASCALQECMHKIGYTCVSIVGDISNKLVQLPVPPPTSMSPIPEPLHATRGPVAPGAGGIYMVIPRVIPVGCT